jgi:hypothetical protein
MKKSARDGNKNNILERKDLLSFLSTLEMEE